MGNNVHTIGQDERLSLRRPKPTSPWRVATPCPMGPSVIMPTGEHATTSLENRGARAAIS